ncbi:uncharacterized protein LOC134836624 [Culicoides brevitarsis]|uniref:uncharacterized protein LOC134836624 n=1 Tax=Culicoides brevitarsis TaxID=469753 RepID=UPI00307C4B53
MAEYSSDELVAPDWLDASFFQKVVREFNKDTSIVVKNIATRPGTKPGEHYASVMYRTEVTFDCAASKNNVIKLILKTMPFEEGHKKQFLQETTAFKTEMRMYGEVLPEMQRLLRSINDQTVIAPTLVYKSNEPAPVIVFIDEGPNGFKPYESALTHAQAQVVIDRIAKFHACSVKMNENGIDMASFNDCPFEKVEGRMDFMEFFTPNIRDALKTIKKWKGVDDVIPVLEKHVEVLEERVRELYLNRSDRRYEVLTHGDFQFKNMISRNGGLKSEDYLLLDYQFCYWCTPAPDVLALLYNICHEEVRLEHREETIRKYFTIFTETLQKLQFKGKMPRLIDLQLEILRCGILEYMNFLIFVPFLQIDFSKLDLNEMVEKMDFHSAGKFVFESEKFQRTFLERIRFLINMGVFD